jgi:folate-dependent phosphoribosylglycinamide formyltransferase PurN
LIPEVRGLDALQWALHLDQPLGVTAHLIDHRVDAGRIVERKVVDEFADDTLVDLSLRLEEMQVQMLTTALEIVASRDPADLDAVGEGEYRRSFPAEWSAALPAVLARRQARLSNAA